MRRAELVDRAQAGDVGAFGELYDEYSLTVYRYIYARVSSSALAEDLTSETFVRALRALDSFRWQGRDFGAWLVTIARNLITDHYKSGRVRLEVVTDEIETHDRQTEGPEVDVLAAATAEVLRDAVASLPER
ncbi:sigma-70 family RNA polymerase sigma factor [Kribbella albertanoniae]|uniref:Sigma-70 family RNA polymerase sigma factor n=1 Tax=Kribbella albertanoniae TaxID=1266829 RepID=A0A4V2XSJ3_9ACTN|nr:sigma-70 family RNA polymerase sigma factor [Kribbella albertanoniae]TDC34035.1 sigma-70 family RNA polymerase sigma factor [Kribbella albertanoniae]